MALDSVYNTFTTDPSDTTKIPLVLDTMENTFNITYSANPDRVFVISGGTDSRIAYVRRVITMQFDRPDINMADEARLWLQQNL